MKQKILPKLLLVAVLLLSSLYANAYSFSAKNDDGVTIYYDIVSSSDHTCEVAYKDRYTTGVYSGDIVIPETVKRSGTTYTVVGIGDHAFVLCSRLTSVVIPNSVTYIDYMAFYGCYNLTSINWGTSVESIGELAFGDCSGLTSIDIPDGVITIDDGAFEDCTGLTSVKIPNSVQYLSGFYGCTGLTEITIPDGVTTIGYRAFYYCTGLTGELKIPNSVTAIGEEAFWKCTSLTSVTIGGSVSTIGTLAFEDCTGLTSVTIPDSVTAIEYGAFYRCSGLTSVTIGGSVSTIGTRAFWHCSGLGQVYSLNPEPSECGSSVFFQVDTDMCILYVPIGSYDAYATADQWEEFLNIVEMDMTGIESVSADDATVAGYYTIDGKAVDVPQRGINIVRYSDGKTKKLLVK